MRIPALLVGLFAAPALAYVPGSGTLYTASFNTTLDADWEQGNGVGTSPWTLTLDGTDKVLYADGFGPFPNSATRHWARHFVHPVTATTFSAAFEYRAELGTSYLFDLEVEQRAPVPRKYRLRVDAAGALSLWRTEVGTFAVRASTAAGAIPANQKRWIRLAVEADPSGHPRVRARVWSGSASSEPATWTLEFLDDADTLQRVHRFELSADGPRGIETWIDDLDLWGDVGSGVASSVKTIYVMELSHLDVGFTAPPDTIEAFAKSHLDQVLDNLDADPSYRWTIEEGWWLDRFWERSTDAHRQRMLDALHGGRLKLAAGYASLHTTIAGHEELTRNLYWSSEFAREHGVPLRTWITDDVPGSTFALPELLARSGVDYYVGGMNTPFGGRLTAPDHGDRPFWWVGPDGSRVLSWITFDAYAEAFDWGFSFFDTLADVYTKTAKKLPEQEEAGYPWPELLLMRGFDNSYQGFKVRDLVEQWNATYATPKFALATPDGFLDMMRAKYGDAAFPEFHGDFGAAWSNSHAESPHATARVRDAHRSARAAELLHAAGEGVDGAPSPTASFDLLYRDMLQEDEHSGAGAWPGTFTPEETNRNNTIHLAYATDARDEGAALLDSGVDRALAELPVSGDAIVVVNPLVRARAAWARATVPAAIFSGDFRLVPRGGSEIPYQRFDATSEILFRADLPAAGYRVYDLVSGTPTAVPSGFLLASPTELENDALHVVVDPSDGSLQSVYDKIRGVELVDPASTLPFNGLASALKADIDFGGTPATVAPSGASTSLEESGPLRAEIRAARTGTPHVESRYRLYRGDDRLEIENVLDRALVPYVPYAQSYRAYVVAWPFAISSFAIRSETTTRFLDPVADSFARTSFFDWHNVEHVLAFHDGSAGVEVATDAVSSYHFEQLTNLAAASWSNTSALLFPRMLDAADECQFEGGSVGPCVTEPGTPGTLRYVSRVRSTGPVFDPVEASRFGFEALEPLPTRTLAHRPGNLPDASASFFRVDAPSVLLYTVKPAHVGEGLVFRMTELSGTPVVARIDSDVFVLSAAERVEQDEEGGVPLGQDGDGFLVPLGAYETATVRATASPGWEPILLRADKDGPSGSVRLTWTGGNAPFTLLRSEEPTLTLSPQTLQDEDPATTHDDPVLADGATYFYLVK